MNIINSQNLLVNGDFEDFSQMPFGLALMHYSVAWEDFIPNTDYLNLGNSGNPHMGDGFAGFTTYGNSDNDSEAFGQDISANPILADSLYYIEFYSRNTGPARIEITGFPYIPSVPNYNTHPTNLPEASSLFISEQVDGNEWVLHYGYINSPEELNYVTVSAAKTSSYKYMFVDDILIKVPVPVYVSDTTYICSGDSVILDVGREYGSYFWEDGSTDSTFTAMSEGIYEVEVRVRDTIFFREIEVIYDIQPTVEIGEDITFCEGETLLLEASFVEPETEYLWQDSSITSSFLVTETGTYDVQVSLRGCVHFDTIDVEVVSFPEIDFGEDRIQCQGDVSILDATSTNSVYLWQDGTSEPTFTVSESGEYAVTVSRDGCEKSSSVNFSFIDIPEDILGEDEDLCFGETIILDARFPDATYLWQDASTEAQFTVEEPGVYSVSVMVDDCVKEDEVLIEEQIYDCIECDFFFPNAFTPDFDGINDELKILTPCPISEYNYLVFDRWGNLIFQTSNPDEGWDGNYNNKPVANGVYTVFIDFRFTSKKDGELYRTDVLLTK